VNDKIVTAGPAQHEVSLERIGPTVRSGELQLEILASSGTELEIRIGGIVATVPFVVQGTAVHFWFDGEIYVTDVIDKGSRGRARHRDHSTEAPMPGAVLKILVRPGDVVTRGTQLLILEAMKMEHPVVAPRDGTVEAIHCREGELVQPGVELVTFK
jgi:3-methylcrotonyl-CoA carboxylase alpha subunit